MADASLVSMQAFSSASPRDNELGLLGWVTLEVGGLLLLDVALRRTRGAGRLALSFPERRDANGRRHSLIRPVDDRARREIERQVLAMVRLGEEVAP